MSETLMDDLFQYAESPDLFVQASITNTVNSLRDLLLSSPAVANGVRLAQSDIELATLVLKRMQKLLTSGLAGITERYRHPYDVALATYLLVLHQSNAEAFEAALESVRGSALPNLFWAYAMYNLLAWRASKTDEVGWSGRFEGGDNASAVTSNADSADLVIERVI